MEQGHSVIVSVIQYLLRLAMNETFRCHCLLQSEQCVIEYAADLLHIEKPQKMKWKQSLEDTNAGEFIACKILLSNN